MTDTNQGETLEIEVKNSTKKADHWLIDSTGATTEDETLAAGIGYKLVDLPNEPFTIDISKLSPAAQLMLANFGAKTLATNETSQARNNPKGAASAAEQMAAVKDRFALFAMDPPQWIDRTRDGGAKVDRPMLAQAVYDNTTAVGLGTRTVAEILAKLEAEPVYFTKCRNVPAVQNSYTALVGRPVVTVDDLLA